MTDTSTLDLNASAPSEQRSPATRLATMWSMVGPILLVCVATIIGNSLSSTIGLQAQFALVNLVIVLGLQLFIGTSGVLSFGHIAFVAVGAWTFGLTTADPTLKHNIMPDLYEFLDRAELPTYVAVLLAAVLAMLLALVVGPLLMRLNGLQAGIATFALLGVVTQVLTYWTKIGPPSGQSMVGVRSVWDSYGLLAFAVAAIVTAWLYQQTRTARLLRASRESITAAPGVGINVTLHRTIAFVLSAGICGVAGALWAETNAVVQASQLSTALTFTVIGMLVLGGTNSVWGAVVGVLLYSALDVVLVHLQSGMVIAGYIFSIPDGTEPLVLGGVLILMLLFRPQGLTGGREFGWPRRGSAQRPVQD